MSDDNILEEPFQVDGRYNQDIDRNGDRVPDRMQQGFDSGTGDPLDLPAPVRFGLDHVDNTPDERSHREKLVLLGATFDNSEGLTRDPEARSSADSAVAGASAVERSIDSKPSSGPNFHERAAARALWERRKDMPKKEPGLLKNLRQIQTGSNDGKTGIEVLQSLGHGVSAGLMIGARQAARKEEIRIYRENEEFHLRLAREKDRSTEEANKQAAELLNAVNEQGGNTPPAGGTPTPDAPEPGPAGPGDGSRNSNETVVEAKEAERAAPVPANDQDTSAPLKEAAALDQSSGPSPAPSFAPQQVVTSREDGGRDPAAASGTDQAKSNASEPRMAESKAPSSKSPESATGPSAGRDRGGVDPVRANGTLAAGMALSTVAPVVAPVITAGVTHHAQKEAGQDHGAATRTGTGAKGPGVRDPQMRQSTVTVETGRNHAPGERTLAPAPAAGPRKGNVVDLEQARHRKGTLHEQASALARPERPAMSKGPKEVGPRRPAQGVGMVMAKRIMESRGGIDLAVLDNVRDKRSATR